MRNYRGKDIEKIKKRDADEWWKNWRSICRSLNNRGGMAKEISCAVLVLRGKTTYNRIYGK